MYIQKLIIVNYQSCQEIELELYKDDPSILIGINDCGKSSILKSIDLLFDGKTQFNFLREDKIRSDISNTRLSKENATNLFAQNDLPNFLYDENQTLIVGKLKVEEDDLFSGFEDQFSPHLIWALEKAEGDVLWLMKEFDSKGNTIKDYILVYDVKEKPMSLWGAKATELKQLRKDYEVTDDEVENENKVGRFKNIEQIKSIYSKFELKPNWSEYKEKKKDRGFFPEISYLDWNFSFDELINFTNTIMNQSISSNLDAARSFANGEALKAQDIVNKDLDEITTFLSKEVSTVTKIKSNVVFNVQSKITDLVINKINTDKDIHLESQGDGVKRQIWFAMIKWKAKQTLESKNTNKKLIWCFDEPETHLYPAAQRNFLNKIKTISLGNVQSILSTHSTIFVDRTSLSQINRVSLENAYSKINKCESVDQVFESLYLKNSDFLFYDKFLIIEGETEKNLIPYFYKLYTEKTLDDDNIQLILMSGKDNWLERKKALESVFSNFNKSEDFIIYLFDADMKFDLGENAITDNMCFVGKQDIEDSIGYKVWSRVVEMVTDNEIVFAEEEYDRILQAIPNNKKIPNNEKFLPTLEKFVKQKVSEKEGTNINWDILPSKGEALADAISKSLTSVEEIDKTIIKVFNKLKGQDNNEDKSGEKTN